jgi:hypothetical protein
VRHPPPAFRETACGERTHDSGGSIKPAVTVSLAATRNPADLIIITERIREGTS